MTGILKKQKTEQKMSVRYFEGLNLWILAAVFVADIFFQLSEVGSSLFLYIGTFVMIGMLFFLDKDEYIYLTVALLSVMRSSQISNISVVNIIMLTYFFKAYLFENRYKKESEKKHLPRNVVIAGIVFILFSLIYIINNFKITLNNVKLLFFLVYLVDVFRNTKDNKDAEKKFMNIQVYYVSGVLIAVFVALAFSPEISREATRMSVGNGATNQLGISLASCLAFVTLGMTKVTNIKEWSVLAITALPLLYFCFETQSRTSMVGMIFVFASTIFWGITNKESRLWVIMMAIASALVLGGLILFAEGTQLHENIMATIDRFINPKNDDISNGRFFIWRQYINEIKNDPIMFFFGSPLSNSPKSYGKTMAHNMFIEEFAGLGLLGVSVFTWVYTIFFLEIRKAIKSIRKSKIKLLGFVPFALVFIVGMTSHSLQGTEPTVNFFLGVAMIYFFGEIDSNANNVDNKYDTGGKSFSKRKRYENVRRLGYHCSKKYSRFS